MSFLFRIRAIFTITFKRLWAQRSLTIVTTLGLIVAVALISTVPLYADAVTFRILQERLGNQSQRQNRPPFSYLFSYIGAWHDPIEWDAIEGMDDYVANRAATALGLPELLTVRHAETNTYRLYPGADSNYDSEAGSLGLLNFATTTGIEDQIEIIEGALPQTAVTDPNSPIEVMITEPTATELGLQVGDTLLAYDFRGSGNSQREFPVRIAAIWQAKNANDPFWFYSPTVFNDLMLIPEESFVNRIGDSVENELYLAVWYLVLDGQEVGTEDVARLTANQRRVERTLESTLPNTAIQLSPENALQAYQQAVGPLTVLLTAYNIPIIFLILAFIALIVGLSVGQRRNEIAVMRSRGATPWQVVGFAFLEGLILGLIAWVLGSLLGLGFTQLMGRARSFMDFSADTVLRVAVNSAALRAGGVAIILALIAQVMPTITASRDTIITYKQEQARSATKPWWQRMWLDLLLLIPVLYGYYLLDQQGSLIAINEESASDPFQNPLLFLIPALTVFAFTLLFLRILPWVMEAFSWLLFRTNSVGLLMAIRHLARTPRIYATPLILLILTVSLSVFTASLALTMDYQLFDDYLYAYGADLNLTGPGKELGYASGFGGAAAAESQVNRTIYLPVNEYLEFPGVEGATRVGKYPATATSGGTRYSGSFMGVDRTTLPQVSFWRYDFAPYRLGSILNTLATTQDGVLASSDFLADSGLAVGDLVRLQVRLQDADVTLDAQIVGSFDYFPTWYPSEDGALFVGNLDTLFGMVGSDFPYEVWMETTETFDEDAFKEALLERGLVTWSFEQPYPEISAQQTRPERQGLFGLLSIGFLAAALLTVIGFFMYALFSFRRRFIELGILRAVGLSQQQMLVFVACELGFLILAGLTLGTLLGTWVSQLFVPYLQIGTEASDLVPPYLVEIAWDSIYQIYVLFLLLFLVALSALGVLLRRMKIFQAVKLGETA
jgi:putative ABC transport system permease protein